RPGRRRRVRSAHRSASDVRQPLVPVVVGLAPVLVPRVVADVQLTADSAVVGKAVAGLGLGVGGCGDLLVVGSAGGALLAGHAERTRLDDGYGSGLAGMQERHRAPTLAYVSRRIAAAAGNSTVKPERNASPSTGGSTS